jgi:hypothetical protein
MELDTYTRIGLLVTGLLLLLAINLDWTYWISKLIFWKKNTIVTTSEKDFLTMINLWYKLKEMCVNNGFTSASKKLDEVFPLLNNDKSKCEILNSNQSSSGTKINE